MVFEIYFNSDVLWSRYWKHNFFFVLFNFNLLYENIRTYLFFAANSNIIIISRFCEEKTIL